MIPGPPSDDEVVRALEDGLRSQGEPGVVAALERAPYAYATSFPLEEVEARLGDGRRLQLILKDLTWERLLGDARHTKPRFLYEPRRPIDTYRRILAGTDLGVRCYAAVADDRNRRYWLLLEKVAGVELWQVGTFATWESVARWLARLHRAFAAEEGDGVLERNRFLIRYDEALFGTWPARALEAAEARGAGTQDRRRLADIATGYGEVVQTLCALPPTFVHGELYPSNVLVDERAPETKVWPIDWEMAGLGPAYLDLVALTAGWDGGKQWRLVDAYVEELGTARWRREGHELARVLECCRLHYALQWLGWSATWSAPPEHARDWLGEALEVGGRLGL